MRAMSDRGTPKVSRESIRRQRGPIMNLVAKRMQQLGLKNVGEFAEYAGISESAMYGLLNGRIEGGAPINPRWQTIVALAKALDKPAHELLYILDPEAPGAGAVVDARQVPVYVAGCAGAGTEQLVPSEERVYVSAEFAKDRDLIAFLVCGDSMAGGKHPIYDGDVVVVDRSVAGEFNLPVVARLADDGYVCKRLRPGNILDSTNPDYLDERYAVISPDRVEQVVGRVVRIISNAVA